MKIRPSRGYCLIEPLEADEVSDGGVYLPDRVKDMPIKGKVLAIGGIFLKDYEIISNLKEEVLNAFNTDEEPKVGDIVIFKRFVDNKIKEEGKELLLVKFEDILGVYG